MLAASRSSKLPGRARILADMVLSAEDSVNDDDTEAPVVLAVTFADALTLILCPGVVATLDADLSNFKLSETVTNQESRVDFTPSGGVLMFGGDNITLCVPVPSSDDWIMLKRSMTNSSSDISKFCRRIPTEYFETCSSLREDSLPSTLPAVLAAIAELHSGSVRHLQHSPV